MYTGSFTLLAAVRCSCVPTSLCPFVPWGIVFTSVLIIALLRTCLSNGYKFGCGLSFLAASLVAAGLGLVFHLQDSDAAKQLFDSMADPPQRFPDIAAVALIAFAAHRHARSDEKWTINGPDHLERRNHSRITSQRVTAVRTMLRMEQAGLNQALQNLGQRFLGYAVGIRDIFGAAGSLLGMLGQVLHGHQTVIRLFGELQHGPAKSDLFSRICIY